MTLPTDVEYFEPILKHLEQTRGFDFTAYKPTSLMRRLVRRMQVVNVPTFEQYLDLLQVDNEEFTALFNTILINVTSFFRDKEVWDSLAAEVLPKVFAGRNPNLSFRVWSAGCASGQEAYSIAMLLAEQLGPEIVREHVKIYATDLDEDALLEARQATYSNRQVQGVPAEFLEKYFERSGDSYVFNRDLRRAVIFGQHDLVQDAPISRLDLLICRNTLMYFNADAQARILARFYFSLNPDALILLGRAEMLFSHTAMFTPVDLKRRIFKAVAKPNHRDRMLLLAQTGRDLSPVAAANEQRLRDAAFDSESEAQLVIESSGTIVAANAAARERFGLTTKDVGRPLDDLELSYRPSDLRASLERALNERRDIKIPDVPWNVQGTSRTFDIGISPLLGDDRSVLGARISFEDVTELKALRVELQHSKQELETAYEELQSTNEELETTNEELQSTVEELETTNEELQSTNEELETMNEELQSTNEELHTTNEELRNRSTELNAANGFLEGVFASLRSAVVVVDSDFQVLVWNDRATELWGVRQTEAQHKHLMSLDIGLPLGELRQPIRDVSNGNTTSSESVLSAINRRGKRFECRVAITPLRQNDGNTAGVIILMEEAAGLPA
jgi:two-component system, chemotaxis family, CheB/CheR fusion protein